jgi:hypothetical protein
LAGRPNSVFQPEYIGRLSRYIFKRRIAARTVERIQCKIKRQTERARIAMHAMCPGLFIVSVATLHLKNL